MTEADIKVAALETRVSHLERILEKLAEEVSDAAPIDRVRSIIIVVANCYSITVDELVSPSRAHEILWPRNIAIHLARTFCNKSLNSLGFLFGRRDHATVANALKNVSQRAETEPAFRAELAKVTARVQRHLKSGNHDPKYRVACPIDDPLAR